MHAHDLPSSEVSPSAQDGADALSKDNDQGSTLVVDLDGTLVATDLLWESLLAAVKQRPWLIMLVPFWLTRGRAVLKGQLAARAKLDPASLPYRPEVLAYLRRQREAGRRLVLATGSDRRLAEAVAGHLDLFEAVLASDPATGRNLTGAAKRDAIRQSEGDRPFEYLGDHAKDLPIWRAAERAHCAGSRSLREKLNAAIESRSDKPGAARSPATPSASGLVSGSTTMGESFPARTCSLATVLRAVRAHQWVKNGLVLVPLLLAHQLTEPVTVALALLAAVLFSLIASSGYLVNDLLDLESDRAHASKQHRPIPSGELPVPAAMALAGGLLVSALAVSAWLLPAGFTAMLAVYFVLSLAYSFYLKQHIVVDVIVLAGFYAYRVLIGAVAIDVTISPWLYAFSMFFFLSLALVKRYADLDRLKDQATAQLQGRGYRVSDLALFRSIGPTVGYMSVLVLAMYISSDRVLQYYPAYPQALWLICPLLLYWITRVWFITHRGEMTDDPLVFALKDPISYLVGLAMFLIAVFAAVPIPTWLPGVE